MKKIKLCIMAATLCLIFGCGKQEKTANKTIQETTTASIAAGSTTEQTTSSAKKTTEASEASTALATKAGSTTEQTTSTVKKTVEATESSTPASNDSSSFQSDFKTASINELKGILDEINKHSKNLTDSSNIAISDAVSLLNWGVGTTLTTAEINDVTASWLNAMGSEEKKGVISWLTQVNKIYKQLLTDGQKDFLTSAGFGDAPYPWSNTPLETVDEIMKKAGIK